MRIILLTVVCLMTCAQLSAQKVLKLYITKGAKVKTVDYYIGQEITFELDNEQLYTYPIINLSTDSMYFKNGPVAFSDLKSVHSYKNYGPANTFSKMFYVFGASWIGFSVVDVTYGDGDLKEVAKTAAIVGATSFAIGGLIKKLFAVKKYPMDEQHFIRVLDMNITPPIPKE